MTKQLVGTLLSVVLLGASTLFAQLLNEINGNPNGALTPGNVNVGAAIIFADGSESGTTSAWNTP